jgi:hypothetical protein
MRTLRKSLAYIFKINTKKPMRNIAQVIGIEGQEEDIAEFTRIMGGSPCLDYAKTCDLTLASLAPLSGVFNPKRGCFF